MRVWVDDKEWRRYQIEMTNAMRDYTPVLMWAGRKLSEAARENFLTQGARFGAPWKPLDPDYAKWKTEHYGPRMILERTGMLKLDLMNLSRSKPSYVSRFSAEFGTTIDYAKYHQTGTRHMPKRVLLKTPEGFPLALAERAAKHSVPRSGPTP